MPIRGSHKSWALWTACVSSPWNELILNATKSLFNSASTSLSLSHSFSSSLSLSLSLSLFPSIPSLCLPLFWMVIEKREGKKAQWSQACHHKNICNYIRSIHYLWKSLIKYYSQIAIAFFPFFCPHVVFEMGTFSAKLHNAVRSKHLCLDIKNDYVGPRPVVDS